MSFFNLPVSLALVALLSAPLVLGAAENNEHNSAAPPIVNTVCPMDGNKLDPMNCPTVMITVGEGAGAKQCRMACCSEACCTEFKKDPVTPLKAQFGKNAPGPKSDFK